MKKQQAKNVEPGEPSKAPHQPSTSAETHPSVTPQAKPLPPQQAKGPKLPVLEGHNWLLHLYYVRKDFKACKDLIKEQMALTNGMCEYAIYVQALIMRQEGRIQESLELFQNCSVLNPSNILNLKQVARSLFLLGRHKAAIDVYNSALKIAPADWEIIHNLGICYWHMKNSDKAKSYFKEALNIAKNESTFLMLAKILIKEGNPGAAIEILNKAIEFNTESCELLTLLGLLYMRERQYQKSFEALGNALTYNPTYYKSIVALCNMIQIHNDHDVALNKYRIAADTAPESARLWNNIAMCFLGKKKYVAAISCLKRATYLSPFDWKILYNLGLVHIAMQQYSSAFIFLNSAISFKPKEGIIYSLLAVALTHLEDVKNAKEAYEHSLQLDGENIYTNLNYAVFLYNVSDRQGAAARLMTFRKHFENVAQGRQREIDPELYEMSSRLGQLLQLGPTQTPSVSGGGSGSADSSAIKQQQASSSESGGGAGAASNKYLKSDTSDLDSTQHTYHREQTVASISNVGFRGKSANVSAPPSHQQHQSTSDLLKERSSLEKLDK